MTSKIEKLEKLLSEATTEPNINDMRLFVKAEIDLQEALRNCAPLLLEIVKAAKAPVCEHDSGSVCSYLMGVQMAVKKFEESEL